jgi:hypothetical protein
LKLIFKPKSTNYEEVYFIGFSLLLYRYLWMDKPFSCIASRSKEQRFKICKYSKIFRSQKDITSGML